MTGTLYGVGVGPGDPDLITVKAQRLLQRVPVIAWPAPLEGPSLAREIAAPHIPPGKIEIGIRMPMVEARFPAQSVYDEAGKQIADHLAAGDDVAVLCEGDPFFYGSFMYLHTRLAERFPVSVIPGVSSLTAAAAMAGAPLAARNDSLTVLPGPLDTKLLERRLEVSDAAVFIKVGRHLSRIRDIIGRAGLMTQAVYVQHATMDKQVVLPLDQVGEDAAPYFSIILVHRRGRAAEA